MLTTNNISAAWNKFFFEPKPVEGMALFRIFWCLILLVNALLYIPNINDFYGPHAILSFETVKTQFNYLHLNIFNMLPVSYEMVYAVIGIYIVALLSALVGYHTRISLIISYICLISLHHRNIWLLSSAEMIMRSMTIFLICSPCGNALSIDSLRGERNPKFKQEKYWAPWALRLIQIQTSVIYVWTVWHKIKGDAWFDGSAVYYATRLQDFYNFPVPFLLDSPLFLTLLTWGTVVLEVSLGTLVWVKEFRRPVIIAGMLFHVGIEYAMSIPFFEIIMLALLMLYFTPEELKSFVIRLEMQWKKIREGIQVKLDRPGLTARSQV